MRQEPWGEPVAADPLVFSDAVFAVSATLLVLDIRVPVDLARRSSARRFEAAAGHCRLRARLPGHRPAGGRERRRDGANRGRRRPTDRSDRGMDKLWSIKSRLEIPLAHVAGVIVSVAAIRQAIAATGSR